MRVQIVALMILFGSCSASFIASASPAIPAGYKQVAAMYNIPPKVFFAIALQESGLRLKNGRHLPYPWTLNVAKKGLRFADYQQACAHLIHSIRHNKSTDIGLMQIHWQSHKKRLPATASPCVLLQPKLNLHLAALIYAEQFSRSRNVWTAVGHYHHPSKEHFAKRYRRQVWNHYRRLK